MPLKFHKMHGLGNDFVVIDNRHGQLQLSPQQYRQLADRQRGIGCDQILVLTNSAGNGAVAGFEIINSDGSGAEQCGNGVRCLALLLKQQRDVGDEPFRLQGVAGDITLQNLTAGRVRVNMGKPAFQPNRIPLEMDAEAGWYQAEAAGEQIRFGAVSLGNPHAVILTDDVDDKRLLELGGALSRHPLFPQGCNAGLATLNSPDRIDLRVFERGAGPTQACGSGACAAMAVLRRNGLLAESVTVRQSGGEIVVQWPGGEADLWMEGPATYVYKGIIDSI